MKRQTSLLCWTSVLVLASMRVLVCGEAKDRIQGVEPTQATRVEQALERRISVDFVDTPISGVAAFLAGVTGVTFVLDVQAASPVPVTFNGKDMRLAIMLKLLLKRVGLTYRPEGSAIYVASPARMAEVDKIEKGLSLETPETRAHLARPVSLDFVDTPMSDVAPFMGDITGLNVVLDAKADHMLTLKVANMPFRNALIYIARLTSLRLYATDNVIVFTDEEPAKGK